MKKITKTGTFTLLLVSSLTIMVGSVVAPSLSEIVKNTNFQFSPSWLITLPSLGVVVFAPLVGKLINKFGTIKLLCFGLIPYAILGVLGAFIFNDYLLILDRFLLGAATVAVQVASTAYIAQAFVGEDRIKMIAWQGMSIELGGVVFLAIGGVLGEMNWKYPFFIYLLAILCLFLVLKTLPIITLKKVETTIENSNTNKFKIHLIFGSSLLAMMLFFVSFVTLPLHLPQKYSFSESNTGYLMAFISLIAIITASQMPKMVKKLGNGKTVILGFVFFMMGYLVLSVTSATVYLILSAIFIGIGFGFTIPLLNHMMVEASNSKNQGKNLGLFSMGVFGGQFLSTFIEYLSKDYTAIYSISVLLAFVIAIVLFFLFKKVALSEK